MASLLDVFCVAPDYHHIQMRKNKTFSVSVAARNHVNRMCLAADIPLIESGTAGYLGQVTVIKKVEHTRLCCVTCSKHLLHRFPIQSKVEGQRLSHLTVSLYLCCPFFLPVLVPQGMTECYECQPKPTQKTFPGCTIRNTPSEPIHCIVWAKYLFK